MSSKKRWLLISAGIFIVQALALYLLGHIWICKCGYIKLWHGITYSSENSQHLSDWYSLSHIIHGFAFYWLAWLLLVKHRMFNKINIKGYYSVGLMFLLALVIESAWEIWENTDFIINRYREVTISLDYYGDSIINSIMDTLFMVAGFWWAYKMPVWSSILLTIIMEAWVGWSIRDNLTLNLIMLIYSSEAILKWQSGG